MSSPRLSVRLFVSGADLGNPWGAFFHIVHTHPLRGVDVHFGGYDLGRRPTFRPK